MDSVGQVKISIFFNGDNDLADICNDT